MSSRGGRSEGGMSEGEAFHFIGLSYVMMLRGELKPYQLQMLNSLPNDSPTGNTWAQHVEKELNMTKELKREITNMPVDVDSEEILAWLRAGRPASERPG